MKLSVSDEGDRIGAIYEDLGDPPGRLQGVHVGVMDGGYDGSVGRLFAVWCLGNQDVAGEEDRWMRGGEYRVELEVENTQPYLQGR